MQIDEIPFNRLIALQREPAGGEFAVSLPASADYHNHLGIVHAAAQLAVHTVATGLQQPLDDPEGCAPEMDKGTTP